eukprot:gene57086-biopygen88119
MAGGSVAVMVRKFGPLRPPTCASYMAQALAGLEHLHSRGIVHSDVKP